MVLLEFQTPEGLPVTSDRGVPAETPYETFQKVGVFCAHQRWSQLTVAGDAGLLRLRLAERAFAQLSAEWRTTHNPISSADEELFVESRPYQQIIGLGWDIVPMLLRELQKAEQRQVEPDPWFYALAAITKENPVPPETRGNLRAMTRAWIRWGFENFQLLE